MPRQTVTVDAPHRHVESGFPPDWFAIKLTDETLVVNVADSGGGTVYKLSDTTRNPRVMAQADAVLYEGIVGLTDYEDKEVTIQHRVGGIEERVVVDEFLNRPVPTLDRTSLVELEGDKFDGKVEFICIDCGEAISREPTQMDVPGVTPQRCTDCTMAKVGKR